jgi:hypothetical protein
MLQSVAVQRSNSHVDASDSLLLLQSLHLARKVRISAVKAVRRPGDQQQPLLVFLSLLLFTHCVHSFHSAMRPRSINQSQPVATQHSTKAAAAVAVALALVLQLLMYEVVTYTCGAFFAKLATVFFSAASLATLIFAHAVEKEPRTSRLTQS